MRVELQTTEHLRLSDALHVFLSPDEFTPSHPRITRHSLTSTPPPPTQVLRVPWYEWNELGFREDERVAYLESLLLRVAGLTIDEARVVPGGVKLSHRVQGENRRHPYTGQVSDGDEEDRLNPPRPRRGMAAFDIDKSGRIVKNSPRAGAGRGRYVLGEHDGSRSDPKDLKSVADAIFDDIVADSAFEVNEYDPRNRDDANNRTAASNLGGMDGYRERQRRADGKKVVVRRDGSLTVTTESYDPTLGTDNPNGTSSPGKARRSDSRPYGMDPASMGAQERLDRMRRARGDEDEDASTGNSSTPADMISSPKGIVEPLPSRPAPRARARLAPLSSASKRAAVSRRVVRSAAPRKLGDVVDTTASVVMKTPAAAPKHSSNASLSGLKGLGPGSVAALSTLGVHTVGDLAAMPDDAVDEAKRSAPRLKLSHLRKVARAAIEPE